MSENGQVDQAQRGFLTKPTRRPIPARWPNLHLITECNPVRNTVVRVFCVQHPR